MASILVVSVILTSFVLTAKLSAIASNVVHLVPKDQIDVDVTMARDNAHNALHAVQLVQRNPSIADKENKRLHVPNVFLLAPLVLLFASLMPNHVLLAQSAGMLPIIVDTTRKSTLAKHASTHVLIRSLPNCAKFALDVMNTRNCIVKIVVPLVATTMSPDILASHVVERGF
jgi:hypothetical protein